MRHHLLRSAAAAALVLGCAGIASAHPGHAGHEGDHFGNGFQHPLLGLDHLLAMIAVGLLAARCGGKALWALPLAFLTAMTAGGLLANTGLLNVGAGPIDYAIMASVLILGTLLAATQTFRLSIGIGLVALFATFHGYAHAAEMAGGSFAAYAAGFLASTALLHIAGIAGGLILTRLSTNRAWRFAGACVSACGLLMLLGVV